MSAHAKLMANAANTQKLASEAVGMHTGMRPMVRERPASDATVQLRNPAIRDGLVSSEPVGMHTGVTPRRTADPRARVELPQTGKGTRPRSAQIWTTTLRVSDAIGVHPRPRTPDPTDVAAIHYEAQFATRFGDNGGHMGALLSSGAKTDAAVAFQQAWVAKAKQMNAVEGSAVDASEGKTVRDDGAMMEKLAFDAVYSNRFALKDTESIIGKNFVPIVDPRRDKFTRPKGMAYGRVHQIQTAYGQRTPLPTRSVLGIGEGRGRTYDF